MRGAKLGFLVGVVALASAALGIAATNDPPTNDCDFARAVEKASAAEVKAITAAAATEAAAIGKHGKLVSAAIADAADLESETAYHVWAMSLPSYLAASSTFREWNADDSDHVDQWHEWADNRAGLAGVAQHNGELTVPTPTPTN